MDNLRWNPISAAPDPPVSPENNAIQLNSNGNGNANAISIAAKTEEGRDETTAAFGLALAFGSRTNDLSWGLWTKSKRCREVGFTIVYKSDCFCSPFPYIFFSFFFLPKNRCLRRFVCICPGVI